MTTFLKAALSYYGIHESANAAWGVDQSGGLTLVVDIAVHDDNLPQIAKRMEAMRADAKALEAKAFPQPAPPSDKRMRDEYSAMDKVTKSHFGSFTNYKAWRLGVGAEVDPPVEVPAVDEPVRVADVVPPYVWMQAHEITPQQKAMAVGMDGKGRYAIALDDLTEAQKHMAATVHIDDAEVHMADGAGVSLDGGATMRERTAEELRAGYVERTVAAQARLNGADDPSKPCKNEMIRNNVEALPKSCPRCGLNKVCPRDGSEVGYQARLNGADGKPTSNADDWGGLPG